MKLRQKLAVALASAMVITSVPVVTMAASTNRLVKETIKVAKDGITTTNALKVEFKDSNAGNIEVFYLELENAEWDFTQVKPVDATVTGNVCEFVSDGLEYEIQGTDKKVVKVTYTVDGNKERTFPIFAKATGGDAKISVVTKGGNTTVSEGSFVFATTSEKKATVSVQGQIPTFYTEGKIATVAIEEAFTGAMAGQTTKVDIELANTDYKFDLSSAELSDLVGAGYVEFGYGFSGATGVTVTGRLTDSSTLEVSITVPSTVSQDSLGVVKFVNLPVKTSVKTPEAGDFVLDIRSNDLVNGANDLVVGKVAAYSTFIQMKDEKPVEIIAGRKGDVEFTIGEIIEDSMIGGREFEITIDNAHFDYKTLMEKYSVDSAEVKAILKNDKLTEAEKVKAIKKLSGRLNLAAMKADGLVKDETSSIATIEFATDADGILDVSKLVVKTAAGVQTNGKADKVTYKLPVCVSINNKDAEKVTVKAEGRALENEVSTTAVTIINPIDITTEALTVKVGLQAQKGGKITIKETDKDMLKKGDIKFSVKNADKGITFAGKATLETEGGIKGTEITTNRDAQEAVVTLNRTSKEAATLTISDFVVTVDRTVPEGSYDLVISGDAIDADGHEIVIEDFIVVGTPNTQDIAANGLAKGTATFVIGEATYTMNGVTKEMSAKSYIQDPGFTMVPVRYVAEAFGVAESDILFSKGTATIFAGNRTIQLTAGSDVAIVNGAAVTMGTKVVINEGRTYAPVGEIARILGVSTKWDSATKTATFENK